MTRTQHYLPTLMLIFMLGALNGCALTSKASATQPRYFSPDLSARSVKEGTRRSEVELRLGRITAGSYIREKIVYRDASYEVGFYDDRLWTEKPDDYLRRALNQVLFEEEGLRNTVLGPAPVLDVELLNFEEVRAPTHIARVRIAFSLRDDHRIFLRHTLGVERPIALGAKGLEPAAVAEALGEALRTAVHEVSELVMKELAAGGAAHPKG